MNCVHLDQGSTNDVYTLLRNSLFLAGGVASFAKTVVSSCLIYTYQFLQIAKFEQRSELDL